MTVRHATEAALETLRLAQLVGEGALVFELSTEWRAMALACTGEDAKATDDVATDQVALAVVRKQEHVSVWVYVRDDDGKPNSESSVKTVETRTQVPTCEKCLVLWDTAADEKRWQDLREKMR